MTPDVWTIVMWATGASGITALLGRIWQIVSRTRADKRTEQANARIAGVNADKAELELWEEERKSLLESKNFWLGEFNRVDKLLVDYKRESDVKIEELGGEIKKLRAAWEAAVGERDAAVAEAEKLKSLLAKLVSSCKCGAANVDEYIQALT